MSKRLQHHSVFFWMHLYRRIGVRLSPKHEDKTDPHTVALVRNIVKLAIAKYGDVARNDDLKHSSKVKFREVLGGEYRRIWLMASSKPKEAMKGFRILRENPQLVATDFSADDLVDIFAVEGLAYEYWRTTALLRAIGKGAEIRLAPDEWVDYRRDEELASLVRAYDARLVADSGATLAGTWTRPTPSTTNHLARWLPIVHYNVERLGREDGVEIPGMHLPPKAVFVPNFLSGAIDIIAFRDANLIPAEAFMAIRGYSLDAFLLTLWGLTNAVVVPAKLLFGDGEMQPAVFGPRGAATLSLHNLMQRGYATFPLQPQEPMREIQYRADILSHPFVSEEQRPEIEACVRDLTLTTDSQQRIALWSGGPRFPLIPFGETCLVVDLQGFDSILRTLFVGIGHDHQQRGLAFEDHFRAAVRADGYLIPKVGVIENQNGGKREVDLAVRIGERLYLFECLSAERPLNFDLGHIATIQRRTNLLAKKLEQALSLAEFVRANRVGRNYDFEWAREIIPFVVSPMVEWVWSLDERLWHDSTTPRVISADEALRILCQASRSPGAS